MTTDNDQPQAEPSPRPNFPGGDRPLVPGGLSLGEMFHNLIGQIEELRLDFNRLGSPKDTALVDIIIARLLMNDDFHSRIAKTLYEMAAASAKSNITDKMATGDNLTQSGELPAEMKLQPGSDITAGYYEFEGSDGFLEIELNETGEGVATGILTVNGSDPRPLNLEDFKDGSILNAINESYKHTISHEPVTHVSNGDRFWYRIDNYVEPPEGYVRSTPVVDHAAPPTPTDDEEE